MSTARSELFALLLQNSVRFGEFTLKSGAKSNFYIDCRQTALDARGAVLIGEVLYPLIAQKAAELGVNPASVGGLTLGADPVSLAVAIRSHLSGKKPVFHAFCVRKEPKGHGLGKQVEGRFQSGDTVVAIDDVITTGGSTLTAIEAIEREGGKVAFVAALVDREEGGRENLESRGYPVISAFRKSEFLAQAPVRP